MGRERLAIRSLGASHTEKSGQVIEGAESTGPGAAVLTTAPGLCYAAYARVSDSGESSTRATGESPLGTVQWVPQSDSVAPL